MGKRNDDRSDSMNPNNPAYQASMDNRSSQLNPNHPDNKIFKILGIKKVCQTHNCNILPLYLLI